MVYEIPQILNTKTPFLKSIKTVNKDLETIFLITSPELAQISSSIIREVHRYGGDVSSFLPYEL